MIKEGLLISGNNSLFNELKIIAIEQIDNGPASFSKCELDDLRYFITDLLDDLIGSETYEEWIFIVNELISPVLKLDIVMKGHWLVNGKRIPRFFGDIDRVMYDNLLIAYNCLFLEKSKKEFTDWVYCILNQYGGRLDAGYCRGNRVSNH